MVEIKIAVDCYRCQQLAPIGLDGRIDKLKEKRFYYVATPLGIESSDRTIDVGMLLEGELLQDAVAQLPETDRMAVTAYYVGRESIRLLERGSTIELYRSWNILISATNLPAIPKHYEIKESVHISDDLALSLRNSTTRHRESEAAFEKAKQFLEDHLFYLPHHSARAQRAAHFIAACMRADGQLFMGAWNEEKSARLLREVADLARRKDVNHPNYKHTAESVRSTLYTLHFPTIWAQHPPGPNLLSL